MKNLFTIISIVVAAASIAIYLNFEGFSNPTSKDLELQTRKVHQYQQMNRKILEFYRCSHYKYQQAIVPSFGQHLVCLIQKEDEPNRFLISIIKDSLDGNEVLFEYVHEPYTELSLISVFGKLFDDRSEQIPSLMKKWKAYTFDGMHLPLFDDLIVTRNFAIYSGGVFLWPGVSIGYKRNVSDYVLETLSLRPLVFGISNFLSTDECEYIRSESMDHMEISGTMKQDQDRDKPDSTWRTSTQHYLESMGKPVIEAIDARTSFVTRTGIEQQEFVQVLRYQKGQFYDQHHDYFDAQFYQSDPSTLALIRNGEKNRLATVFWYLSTISEAHGGHTIFPLTNGNVFNAYTHNYKSCDVKNSLKIRPVQGYAIIFYSLFADGALDPTSLHGACPVEGDAEKWAANKWIWNEPTGYYQYLSQQNVRFEDLRTIMT